MIANSPTAILLYFRKLVELGLLEPLVGQALTEIIYKYIENHIVKTCKDSFDISYVDSLEKVSLSHDGINTN